MYIRYERSVLSAAVTYRCKITRYYSSRREQIAKTDKTFENNVVDNEIVVSNN